MNDKVLDLDVIAASYERQRQDTDLILSLTDLLAKSMRENQTLKERLDKLTPKEAPHDRKE